MIKKFGDLNPISVIYSADVDPKTTSKSLKAAIKSVKNEEKKEEEVVSIPSKSETETN